MHWGGRKLAQQQQQQQPSIAQKDEGLETAAAAAAATSSSSSSVADLWATADTPQTQVIYVNSSSFADFAAAAAAPEATADVQNTAAAAVLDPTAVSSIAVDPSTTAAAAATAAQQAVSTHTWPPWTRPGGDNGGFTVNCVMLRGKTLASSQMWLAGLSSSCGRFQNGRMFMSAPMSACWVPEGEHQGCGGRGGGGVTVATAHSSPQLRS